MMSPKTSHEFLAFSVYPGMRLWPGRTSSESDYFRDIDKREVDFVILENGNSHYFIECKSSGKSLSPSLHYL